MTISVAQASSVTVNSSATTSGSATFSSTPTSGNMLVFLATIDKSSGTCTAPSGFTLRASETAGASSLMAATKISDGTESGAISGSWATSRRNKCQVVELQADGTISYDNAGSNYESAAGTSISTTSISTGAGAAFGVVLFGDDSAKADPADPDPTGSWDNGFSSYTENWFASAGNGEPAYVFGTGSVTESSTAESTYSHDGNSDQMSAAILTFIETGGGGGSSVSPSGIQTVDYQFSAVQAANIKGGLQ